MMTLPIESGFSCVPTDRLEEFSPLQMLEQLPSDRVSNALARERGLSIQTISWEDTARFKNSCWGPNISDMTLQVQDKNGYFHRMPVIRQPNFTDKTADVPLEAFLLPVGNEKGAALTKVNLRQYLQDASLLSPKDTCVIHSVQACFLPAAVGEEVSFNVALFNYQSTAHHPAVLTLVVSEHGTSAQVIDNGDRWDGQRLMFNKNGKSCDFVAERLQDARAKTHRAADGPLSAEEQAARKLLIIQIPLKVPPRPERSGPQPSNEAMCCTSLKCDIDDAQIKIGRETGDFVGLKGLKIERDERFPIRVTTQIYKIADTNRIDRTHMEGLAAEIKAEEAIGERASSLVIEDTNRPTEWGASSLKAFLFRIVPYRFTQPPAP